MDDIGEGETMNGKERMKRYLEALFECTYEINRRVSPWYTNTLEIIYELSMSERCRENPYFIDCDPNYIAEKRSKAIQEAIHECVKKKIEQEGF